MEKRGYFYFFILPAAALAVACQNVEPQTGADNDAGPAPVETAAAAFDAAALWDNVRADFDLFYAYRDLRGFDADAYLDRVGVLASTAPDRKTFRRHLHRATYAFTDPHLAFGPLKADELNTIPTASDLQVGYEPAQNTSGRYRILDVRADSAAAAAGLRPGWEVISVDDIAIEVAALAVFTDLIDSPSDAQRAYAATLLSSGRREGDRQMTVQKPGGSQLALTLANPRDHASAVMDSPMIVTQRITAPDGSNIAVLRINNRLGDNDMITAFDKAVADVVDADGLILDLRNTPSGGNAEVGRSIMGHFTTTMKPFQVHERPSLAREFSVPRRYIEQVFPRPPFFDPAQTVVLGGYWTGSMGEGIVIGMDAMGIQTIASDMGDLLGGMSNFSFDDNKITLAIPTETLFHIDGTPREDFVADTALLSADTDADGSDPAMAAALAHLQRP
jgi:carboxyl-terminal processing protease